VCAFSYSNRGAQAAANWCRWDELRARLSTQTLMRCRMSDSELVATAQMRFVFVLCRYSLLYIYKRRGGGGSLVTKQKLRREHFALCTHAAWRRQCRSARGGLFTLHFSTTPIWCGGRWWENCGLLLLNNTNTHTMQRKLLRWFMGVCYHLLICYLQRRIRLIGNHLKKTHSLFSISHQVY
jgi:hypothetical protein